MTINANRKFLNAILSRISNYDKVSERKITDLNELNSILETATGSGYKLSYYSKCLVGANAQEYSYENGLKYLISKIAYKDDKNIRTIEQHTLTADYNTVPLINVVIEKDKKALQQLLISSSSKDEIFPESMKNIEIEGTTIYVNNRCGSYFETYSNLNDGSLMLEKYMQFYPASKWKNSKENLLWLCGCGSRDLEIIYNNEEPIYAQLSEKYEVEMAGFDPNSSIDAKIIVGMINSEVDAILAKFHLLVDEYDRQNPLAKR